MQDRKITNTATFPNNNTEDGEPWTVWSSDTSNTTELAQMVCISVFSVLSIG